MCEFEPQANEVFVPIRGFENYLISNQGRVWNSKTKRFVGCNNGNGYQHVLLRQNGTHQTFTIHRLVMTYFGPPQPEGKTDVDHIDRDKSNNRIENLRWVNKSENARNKGKYKQQGNEFLDELPDTAVELEEYNGFEFNRYWFDYNSKRLIMRTRSGKLKFVNVSCGRFHLYDVDEIEHTWQWKKFHQEMMNRHDEDSDEDSDEEGDDDSDEVSD